MGGYRFLSRKKAGEQLEGKRIEGRIIAGVEILEQKLYNAIPRSRDFQGFN